MGPSLRALGLALVCTHLVVASTPCGGTRAPVGGVAAAHEHAAVPAHGSDSRPAHGSDSPPAHARDARAAHAPHASRHHAAAHGPVGRRAEPADAEATGGPGWRAICPCGCDRAPDARVPGRALDPALRWAEAPAPAPLAIPFAPWPAPQPIAALSDRPEPVPRPA